MVAMIGGGQLARMTHQAAIALGQTLRVLAVTPDDPAAQVTPDVVIGAHTDLDALRRAADGRRRADVRPRARADRAAREAGRRGRERGPAAGGADPRPGQVGDAAAAGGARRADSAVRGGDGRRPSWTRSPRASANRSCSRPRAAATTAAACCWPATSTRPATSRPAISPTASRCSSRSAWRCGASWPRWWRGRRSARARRGRWWRPCSATASASR